MKAQIDTLIKRYWAGESTLEDEAQLKTYLSSDAVLPEHQEMKDLFAFMDNQATVQYPGAIDIATLTQATVGMGAMDELVEKYLDAETSLEEEQQLRSYLSSQEVAPHHEEVRALFSFATAEVGRTFPGKLDIAKISSATAAPMDILIEKYHEGETSLEEEAQLKSYLSSDAVAAEHRELIPLFAFYKAEREVQLVEELDTSFLNKAEPKTRILEPVTKTRTRSMFPRMVGIAATLGLLLMFTFNVFQNTEATYLNQYTEVQDPEEALEITKDALAFLGVQYETGTESMKYIKELEKSSIFNFKN